MSELADILHEIHKDQPLFGFPMTCEALADALEHQGVRVVRSHVFDGTECWCGMTGGLVLPEVDEVQPS